MLHPQDGQKPLHRPSLSHSVPPADLADDSDQSLDDQDNDQDDYDVTPAGNGKRKRPVSVS